MCRYQPTSRQSARNQKPPRCNPNQSALFSHPTDNRDFFATPHSTSTSLTDSYYQGVPQLLLATQRVVGAVEEEEDGLCIDDLDEDMATMMYPEHNSLTPRPDLTVQLQQQGDQQVRLPATTQQQPPHQQQHQTPGLIHIPVCAYQAGDQYNSAGVGFVATGAGPTSPYARQPPPYASQDPSPHNAYHPNPLHTPHLHHPQPQRPLNHHGRQMTRWEYKCWVAEMASRHDDPQDDPELFDRAKYMEHLDQYTDVLGTVSVSFQDSELSAYRSRGGGAVAKSSGMQVQMQGSQSRQ